MKSIYLLINLLIAKTYSFSPNNVFKSNFKDTNIKIYKSYIDQQNVKNIVFYDAFCTFGENPKIDDVKSIVKYNVFKPSGTTNLAFYDVFTTPQILMFLKFAIKKTNKIQCFLTSFNFFGHGRQDQRK